MGLSCMHPADELVQYMERIYQYGLTTTSGGNLSIMDENGDIWITPAGTDKGTMSREEIVCVKKNGRVIGHHRPSSEYPFHKKIYQAGKNIRAVLHAHAPALTAFSVARQLPDLLLLPLLSQKCGSIAMADYAMTGSEELGDQIASKFSRGHDIVILENHGLVSAGASMQEAFLKFEALEFGAQIESNARKLGKCRRLGQRQFEKRPKETIFLEGEMVEYSSEEKEARTALCHFVRRACRQRLSCGAWASASVRLSAAGFVITSADADGMYIKEEDLIHIEGDYAEQGKSLDEYTALHKAIYDRHPHVGALLIAQPVHAMAFALTDEPLCTRLIPESYMVLQDLPKYSFDKYYFRPGLVAKEMGDKETVLILENDAIVAVGKDLLQAYDRLEVAEFSARAQLQARELGGAVEISDEQIEKLRKKFHIR